MPVYACVWRACVRACVWCACVRACSPWVSRMWHLRKYRKVFVGKEAVDWLISPASGLALATRYTRHTRHTPRRSPRAILVARESLTWALSAATCWWLVVGGGGGGGRAEAVELGNRLMAHHYLHHVTHDHPFADDHLFYRFIQVLPLSPPTTLTDLTCPPPAPRPSCRSMCVVRCLRFYFDLFYIQFLFLSIHIHIHIHKHFLL